MKFQLNGMQRDLVTSYAIHQDAPSLFKFIEDLVNEYAYAQPALPEKTVLDADGNALTVVSPEVPSGKTVDGGTQAPAKK